MHMCNMEQCLLRLCPCAPHLPRACVTLPMGGQSNKKMLGSTLATAAPLFPSVKAQVRIEQVLISGPPLLLSFKLGQLLAFYRDTIEVRSTQRSTSGTGLLVCRAYLLRLLIICVGHQAGLEQRA